MNVFLLNGLPIGKLIILGIVLLKLLNEKHIIDETTHWNHVINKGASKLTDLLLNNVLLTNTVKIDTILKESGGINY